MDSNRKCSAVNIGAVNRRLDETVAAGKAKPSATSKVGNVNERAKVNGAQPRRTLNTKTAEARAIEIGRQETPEGVYGEEPQQPAQMK